MAAPAYRHLARQLTLPDLLWKRGQIRLTMETPGWEFLVASIAEHESRMTAQLLNETTKAEDIPRLRGLVAGLRSMQEAADAILTLADEREAEALKAQETAHG